MIGRCSGLFDCAVLTRLSQPKFSQGYEVLFSPAAVGAPSEVDAGRAAGATCAPPTNHSDVRGGRGCALCRLACMHRRACRPGHV
jgi:hypothetical protein